MAVGEWRDAGIFTEGDGDWFKAAVMETESQAEAPVPAGVEVLVTVPRVIRHLARTPSGTKAGEVRGAVLFGENTSTAANFGTAVHAALATVEWGGLTPELLKAWQAAGWGDLVIAEARACLEAAGVAKVFVRRPGAEVWRERAFEVVLDGAWITGIFDRVVVERDPAGRVVAATIYDFKTDRVEPAELARGTARYEGQLAIYRAAAARLTGLPEAQVGTALVFTALRCVVPVGRVGAD